MSKKKPLISVVLATYNSRRTIEKCLKSISEQTYPNIETIVVDAKTYDKNEQKKCKKIIDKYAIYYQDGPERSIQRNRGIKEAKGEYVLVIDQDMYLTKKVVEDCFNTYQKGDYAALLIPEKSIGEGYWAQVVAFERYISNFLETSLNECVRFFEKKDAEKIGCYDPDLVGAEDSDFHYRLTKDRNVGKIKEVILHDEGKVEFWGRVKKKYYYSKAFRKYLNRYPVIAPKQFFPVKSAYVKHWPLLLKNPHLTIGVILLRSAEITAGGLGVILNRK